MTALFLYHVIFGHCDVFKTAHSFILTAIKSCNGFLLCEWIYISMTCMHYK